jgi:DDE family transposase
MRRSPRNVKIAFSHTGLTHYGGILFLSEFSPMLQLRPFLTRHLRYPRRNHDYELSQMILSLVYPIILGLDRLETTSLLRSNGTFQYLTGLPTYPSPQSLRRFLLQAAPDFREQLPRVNDYLLRHFIHRPDHRSRLILDLETPSLRFSVTRKDRRLVTTHAIEANGPLTRCSVWRRTPRSFGMWDCEAAMQEPGRAARNFWPFVFTPLLPIFGNSACGPMPASVSGQCWTCWKRVGPNTPWSRA